jgi:hypothetical protein
MTTLQAFLLGMVVAWTPSLLLLGWFLLWRAISGPGRLLEDRLVRPRLYTAHAPGGVRYWAKSAPMRRSTSPGS